MSMSAPGSSTNTLQLLLRQVGVICVLLVVAYSGVKAVTEYFSGDSANAGSVANPLDATEAQGAGVTATSADETEVPDDADIEQAEEEAPQTDPPVTEIEVSAPRVDGPPTADNPARVYIVGDSDAGTFGPYLQQLLDGTTVATTQLNYKVSSGLARPDFYNWPDQLAAALPAVDPDIIVATFGGNDAQGLSAFQDELQFVIGDPVANEAEWSAEYTKRAGDVMDLLLEGGRTVIWVGIPNDDNPDVTARLAIQDRAAKAAAAARSGVTFVDTWARFSGREGNWAEFVIDPRDGEGKDVRADDGFHLNVNGAEILALDIAQVVRDDLRARGANI
ncbi:MAG: hypothetical protein ACI83Y_001709 [Candidatus Azotimanducaceae bacterium]|jgi:hypothetical protein